MNFSHSSDVKFPEALKARLFNPCTRIGSYGIVSKDQKILLIDKSKSSSQLEYDLPGGKIEYGEQPREALQREFIEEVCLKLADVQLFDVYSCSGLFNSSEGVIKYHQIGVVFLIHSYLEEKNLKPEENFFWQPFEEIDFEHCTPVAKQALQAFFKGHPH